MTSTTQRLIAGAMALTLAVTPIAALPADLNKIGRASCREKCAR